MAGHAEERAQLRRQVEELIIDISHPDVKQVLRTIAKRKAPMSLESGEIPQDSKPQDSKPLKSKEPDVDPYVGTSKEHEYQKEVFGETPHQQPVFPPQASPPPPPQASESHNFLL